MNKHCENCIYLECEEHGEVCPFYDVEEEKEGERGCPISMRQKIVETAYIVQRLLMVFIVCIGKANQK